MIQKEIIQTNKENIYNISLLAALGYKPRLKLRSDAYFNTLFEVLVNGKYITIQRDKLPEFYAKNGIEFKFIDYEKANFENYNLSVIINQVKIRNKTN